MGEGRVVVVQLDEIQNVTDVDALSQLLVVLGDALAAQRTIVDDAGTEHSVALPVAV